ncbi:MAG: ABC transporter permease [Sphaerochaetaceae bacterium]|jgi:spermidine/putrescine transport system permease protein|nr:ABC transporter permease [Sphaerochaetaceae bacterium]MDD4007017.1 ABC transporter permease [Sphaerochaetaceae bacterium]
MIRKKRNPYSLALIPLYVMTVFLIIGPLLYMLLLSFATNLGSGAFSWKLTLENYRKIGDPVYLDTFWKSIKLAFLSTVLITLIGYPFGYWMSRLSKKGKQIMLLLIMIPFGVNSLIRLYGIIILLQSKGILNGVLIGLHLIKEPLKMLYSYPAVLVGMVYALLPFMVLSIYSSAEKVDWTLVEAARDLGATKTRAFATIVLPLTAPGVFSGVVLSFVPTMGLFFIADILGGNKIVLVGSLIQDQMTRGGNWPFSAAIAVILTIITSVLLLSYSHISRLVGQSGEGSGLI